MPAIGYHASHEQFPPSALLDLVARAEKAGFDCAMGSDHFHPRSRAQGQGQGGDVWSWLGASLEHSRIGHGVMTSPAGRCHLAVVTQATATLAEMFPERLWVALGSDEVFDGCIAGEPWLPKDARNGRLREAAEVMRALWRGEEMGHEDGPTVRGASLYTPPRRPPRLLVATVTPETARWGAGWADGLLTVCMPREDLRAVVEAFRGGGGDGKPMYLQVRLSWAGSEAAALQGALDRWRGDEEDLRRAVRVSADPARHAGWLREDLEMGFDHLYLHNVNRGQEAFIDAFAHDVLPGVRRGR